MIVNHAGYRLLSPADADTGWTGLAVFLGSFAPVVFFFATGFGIGLGVAATGRAPPLLDTAWKAALLVVADQVAYWAAGEFYGLNFFSFIGIAMLTVSLVARAPRSTALALAITVALLLVRYGLGPLVRDDAGNGALVDWVVGVRGVPALAYPLTPWMVYPLVGFVLALRYAGPSRRWLLGSAAVGVLAGGAAVALVALHSALFRWGTVSASFFVLSLGVLAVAGLASMLLARGAPQAAATLSLRGVASFAVIPLHYALLDACGLLTLPLRPWAFVPVVAGIAIASWIGASAIARAVAHPAVGAHRRRALVLLCLAVVVPAVPVALWTLGIVGLMAAAISVFTLLAQLAVAGLLGLRARPVARRIVTPTRV